MQRIRIGSTNLNATKVSYGAWPLSDSSPRPTEAESIEVIHAALDGGATLIDTADAYCLDDSEVGHNERLVAKALKAWSSLPGSSLPGSGLAGSGPRASITVATKGGFIRPNGTWTSKADPAHLRSACEHSLQCLDTDCIDLYQLHAPDPRVPLEDSVGALADLQSEGKIRHIGLSNVSVAEIETARSIVDIVSVQNRLNPFFREAVRDGVVDYCDRNGLAFFAYSPVGGGRLNKKLPHIPELQAIAERHGVSNHAVVLAWDLAQGESVVVIPAARKIEHVLDSQKAGEIELSDEELAAIDAAEFSTA